MLNQNSTLKTEYAVKETTKRYDEIAEEYSNDWRGGHDTRQLKQLEKFEALIGSPPKKILDAGCGTGKDCIYFATHGYEVCGIDISSGMLKKAIENSKSLKINFAIGDIRLHPFPNNFFDGVWTVAAIVHLPPADKQKVIQEAYRVLMYGGILHVDAQNLYSMKRLVRLLQFYLPYLRCSNGCFMTKMKAIREWAKMGYVYLDNRHWFYPEKNSILRMLREAGFSILKSNCRFSKRLSVYAKK